MGSGAHTQSIPQGEHTRPDPPRPPTPARSDDRSRGEPTTSELMTGPPASATHPRRRWVLPFIVLVVAGLGYVAHRAHQTPAGTAAAPPRDRPVPVTVMAAHLQDVPIQLEGLGTVAAFNTVTVRSQVDGRIDKILFREGQDVRKGDVLVEIDPRPFTNQLHRAEAQLARDEAALQAARRNLARYKDLLAQRLIAEQQVDDQQALVDQDEAALALDRSQIDDAKLQLVYAHVTAPIDARTGIRQIDVGNLVHANDANGIVVLTQIDPIAVLFTLPQDDLPRVSAALAAGPLAVEALSRDGRTSLATGEVALIDNEINQATGTMRLKAIFRNPKHALWPNQFVKARMLLTTEKDALVVPATAVQRGPNGTFAYVVDQAGKAAVRPIEVETTTGDLAIIARGLEGGDPVVTEGQYRLAPGAPVDVRKPKGAGSAGNGASPVGTKGQEPGRPGTATTAAARPGDGR